jgi:hypothetical protein
MNIWGKNPLMRSTDSTKRNLKRNTENMFPSPKEVWYTERSGIEENKGAL